MEERLKAWSAKGMRVAQFGEWVVYGVRYESEDGELAWHTTSYPNDNPVHDFWVIDGKFRSLVVHYMYNITYENRFCVGDVVPGVDPDEKDSVLRAIEKWEAEERENARV
jgi:hypothetical protein